MTRHRTTFPPNVNFHLWWFRSKQGVIGQLHALPRSSDSTNAPIRYSMSFYNLPFAANRMIIGNGRWTTDELLTNGITIRRTLDELDCQHPATA